MKLTMNHSGKKSCMFLYIYTHTLYAERCQINGDIFGHNGTHRAQEELELLFKNQLQLYRACVLS